MALEWYFFSPERRNALIIEEEEDLNNDRTAFDILRRSGRLDESFDYEAFSLLVEKALTDELSDYDYSGMLDGFESVMTQLGVMPFDEGGLPPEDPSTV
jgi:hypothetical protein